MVSPLQYTLPTDEFDHPRLFMRNKGQDTSDFLFPTVATVQSRIAGTHLTDYQGLIAYADSHLPEVGNDGPPHAFFIGDQGSASNPYSNRRDPEFSSMYAFIARMQNFTISSYYNKANSIADSLIAARAVVEAPTTPSDKRNKIQREHGVAAAQIYDWNWPQLNNGNSQRRRDLYLLIKAYAEDLVSPSDNEYLWGVIHGDLCYAAQMLPAILKEEFSTAEDNSTKATLDEILEALDPGVAAPGTKQLGYWPVFRYFGNDDGGTHKGSGPGAYSTIQTEFYSRLMQTFRTALQMDAIRTEPWFKLLADWNLWNWRCDRTIFRQHETDQNEAYSQFTQGHCYLAASLTSDTNQKNRWRWLAEEIGAAQSGFINRAYFIWKIVWDQKSPATPTLPTLADVNGGNVMKFFSNAGCTIWREGWSTSDFAIRLNSERFFTEDHQKRSNGDLQWAHNGAPMCVPAGVYDKNQSFTYKALDAGGTVIQNGESGHNWTYAKRILAHNVSRLFSTSEATSNITESFQRTSSSTASRFGEKLGSGSIQISNDGGQLWKKNPPSSGNPFYYHPGSLGDIVGDVAISAFVYSPDPYPLPNDTPVENASLAYQVTDLTGSYWTGKCTRYRRHVLWIKTGQIPPWPRPIVMVWDDIVSVAIDGTAGNKTQVQQWQCLAAPTGSPATVFTITRTGAGAYPAAPTRAATTFIKVVSPTACNSAQVQGYTDLNNKNYPVVDQDPLTDTGQVLSGIGGVWRLELNPTTATTTPNFLVLICPRASGATYDLTSTLINNATQIGATLNGVDVTINKGTTYGAAVGGGGGGTPPPAITDLFGAAGDARVDLNWSDSTDPTVTKYRIYRSFKVAGVYNAFVQIAEVSGAPPASLYADTTAVNGTTYRYKVTVFNPVGESADSNIVQELTPTAPPVFTGTIPWKTSRFTPRYRDSQQ